MDPDDDDDDAGNNEAEADATEDAGAADEKLRRSRGRERESVTNMGCGKRGFGLTFFFYRKINGVEGERLYFCVLYRIKRGA